MEKEKTTKSRIVIVDDHPIFREGLRQVIDREPDLKVCAEADSIPQALQVVEKEKPDLVLVDISLGDASGIDLIRQLKSRHEELPILVISMHDESLYAVRALRTGAIGYLMKQEPVPTMKAAIRQVLRGEVYLSDRMAERVFSTMKEERAVESPLDRLSDRELEVFRLLGRGLGTRQIAEELGLTVPTINSFRARIKDKLQLNSATELVLHAISWVQQEKGTPRW